MNKSGGLLIKNKGRVDVEFGLTGPTTPPLFSHVRLASTACVTETALSKPPVTSLLDLIWLFGRYRCAKPSLHHDTSFSLGFCGATFSLFSSTHTVFLKVLGPGLCLSSDTFSKSLHPSLWLQGQPPADDSLSILHQLRSLCPLAYWTYLHGWLRSTSDLTHTKKAPHL